MFGRIVFLLRLQIALDPCASFHMIAVVARSTRVNLNKVICNCTHLELDECILTVEKTAK